MKQSERQERSRAAILEAAAQEFSQLGYEGVTVDGICAGHGISKGMMYHYFSGREELFLRCVEEVFGGLRLWLEPLLERLDALEPRSAIREYFLARERYFGERPVEKAIFENAMFRTPRGLEERIEALHAPLGELNRRFTLRLTERLQPRPGHSREELQLYFEAIDRAYKTLLDAFTSVGVRSVEEMVERSGRLLDLLIFGIAEQNTDAR